jgi:hypothetical protein
MRRALLAVALLSAPACKQKNTGSAPPAASAAADAEAAAAPRCSPDPTDASFTIGERPPIAADAGDEAVAMPFAVEIGSAVPFREGFAISALRAQAGGTGALVAVTGKEIGAGRLIELGRVYGDPDPPRLAARGERLVAAVPDGGNIRIAAIGEGVTWGSEIAQTRDDSAALDLALGAKRGIVVWDEWDKGAEHGVVRASSFDPADLGAMRPRTISPEGDDAEAPRLVLRSGGFWLVWIARHAPPAKKARAKQEAKPDAAPEDPLVDIGRRWLRIAPLDENGALFGEPRDVTSREAHVLVFDVAPLPGGGAVLAWRDDRAAPGTEGGAVHLARVAPDGSSERDRIEEEEAALGPPAFIADLSPADKAPALWLALGGVNDVTRLVTLGTDGRVQDALAAEQALGSAEPLALSAGRMLVARPRGLAVELGLVRCGGGS